MCTTPAGDVGQCELPAAARDFAANASWLVHWGLAAQHPRWSNLFTYSNANRSCFTPGKVGDAGAE
jgi:hypothetical protein